MGRAWPGRARARPGSARQGNSHGAVTRPTDFKNNMNAETNAATNQEPEVLRLPLWKNCLDRMIQDGLEHSKVYTAEFFEGQLREKRDTMRFGLAISEIRRELEKLGYYLSGRGQHGNQFIILPPENNQDVMLAYQREAINALKRGVILGTTTRLDLLAADDRRKHESILEKMAMRSVLMQRTCAILKVIKTHAPKLLEDKS